MKQKLQNCFAISKGGFNTNLRMYCPCMYGLCNIVTNKKINETNIKAFSVVVYRI